MGNCSCTTNCNPCGPSEAAINQLATKAGAYARQANTYATNAENAWLEFNALYLGAFAVAPTVDNEGDPLQVGALYWNLGSNTMFVWNGTTWVENGNFDEFTNFPLTYTTPIPAVELRTGSEYEIVVVGTTNWTAIGAASATVGVRFTKNAVVATGTGTARVTRDLNTRFADVVNVKDFGAVGDGVTDDRPAFILAANAATAQSKNLLIPDGTYYLTGGGLIPIGDVYIACYGDITGPGAVFTDNGGCPFGTGNYYWNTFGKNQNTLQFDRWSVNASDVDLHSTLNVARRYDGVSNTNAYYASGTPIYGYLHYGQERASQANKASGSANAITGRINVFSLDNGTSGIGRSEMVAAAGAVSCSPTASITAAGNYYNEFSINGPTGTSGADPQREAYMAGATFLVQKYCPGNAKDANHEGSYGVTICTRPGGGGFDFPRPANVENYKLFAGLSVTGWTGVSGTAVDGYSASANSAYDWGIIIGGHGSCWTPFNTNSKIDNGIGIRDYVYSGLKIFSKHPNAVPEATAIEVLGSAGVSIFGFTSTGADTVTKIQTQSSGQLDAAIRVWASSHVTSERAGMYLGDWFLMQDSLGNGTKDFTLYDGTRNVFKCDPTGTDPIWIYVNGTLKKVTEGANDSGGTGFKVLRVVN